MTLPRKPTTRRPKINGAPSVHFPSKLAVRLRPIADISEPLHYCPMEDCCCHSLADLAVVPMGGDGLDERVFATLEKICDHGGDLWWLYLSKCSACG